MACWWANQHSIMHDGMHKRRTRYCRAHQIFTLHVVSFQGPIIVYMGVPDWDTVVTRVCEPHCIWRP